MIHRMKKCMVCPPVYVGSDPLQGRKIILHPLLLDPKHLVILILHCFFQNIVRHICTQCNHSGTVFMADNRFLYSRSASRHFFTLASQCPHIIPSIFIVFSIVFSSF